MDGVTPLYTRDCPAMAAARTGNIPAATRARMQCSTGERKQVAVIPWVAQDNMGRTLLVPMFHETPLGGPSNGRSDSLPLTPRKREILSMLAQEMRQSEIAANIYISVHTVRKHISNATEKLHSHGAMAVVLAAQRQHPIWIPTVSGRRRYRIFGISQGPVRY